jgi:hypothetical protein
MKYEEGLVFLVLPLEWDDEPRRNHRPDEHGFVAEHYIETRCGRFRIEWSLTKHCVDVMHRRGDKWKVLREQINMRRAKAECQELLVAAQYLVVDAESRARAEGLVK